MDAIIPAASEDPQPPSTQSLPPASPSPPAKDEKRWLEPDEHHGEHIAIVSYPRSGNSLMRGLLETITGVYTGCDTRPDRSLSLELLKGGMKGEGVVDDRVWFVKSHYPERSGYVPVAVQKAILVVRNPWDAINSYFNMTLTNSHNKSVHDSMYCRFATRWDAMIQNEIQIWMKFHAYWIAKVDIPIQIVRYEDLLLHRKETMHRVLKFVLNKDPKSSLDGTEWMDRIESILTADDSSTGPYKPRSGKIASSFRHYSPEQFQHVLDVARVHLRNFGYDTETQGFPHDVRLPSRQLRPAKAGGKSVWVLSGDKLELRHRSDTFGRLSTWFRKDLTDPILASDGTELNMHEVEAARERARAAAANDGDLDLAHHDRMASS
ncbi:hypothetical protein H310_10530 [Aphanomyces invadans]|uniref:Sulfotransferase domain-containing protein n=1 Tax=Aphanomyces invadans TaxID=157072 RepID=A0A024TSS6_9STRA|nr:hypothetical protein H310_10530 [Aphanomyces invadans]ETV96377.1 hypothetical protein H310_10530 [Aphanomyces invadans]|eukprot:XP_008875169.1 hypothetical protein H310_10530 [Aphanomyces invadans]